MATRNTDTTAATMARYRSIAVYVAGRRIEKFDSIKECSEALGVPPSRICEFAKSGRVYKNGYQFRYL